jgi:lactocepin
MHIQIGGTINVSFDKETYIINVNGTTIDKSSKMSLLVLRLSDDFRAQIDATTADENGNYNFYFPLENGEYRIIVNSPNERMVIDKFEWTIPDVKPTNIINPTNASFDKRASAQKDIAIETSGSQLSSIKKGENEITKGTDYITNGDTVTIKARYLATLPIGTTILSFKFVEGNSCTLSLSITDSTPPDNNKDKSDRDRDTGKTTPITPATPPVSMIQGIPAVSVPVPTLDAASGAARVNVSKAALNAALSVAVPNAEGIKQVIIPIAAVQGASTYKAILASEYLTGDTAAPTSIMRVQTTLGTLTLPNNMLAATGLAKAGDNVGISLGLTDVSGLSESLRAQIGSRPVFDINLEVNGIRKQWSNPNTPVTVSVKYTPTAEELKNPDNIVIWYLDEATNTPVPIPNCKYDPATGMVNFTTTHFSKYAVAFNVPNITDISSFSWAKKEISSIVVKGILKPDTATTYSPDSNITRAEFMYGLIRSLGLTAKFSSNFSDVNDKDYYYNELGIAKELGIAQGVGDNSFNPASPITRQDIMVLTARAMTKAGKLKTAVSADLSKYTDYSDIAVYAKESMGKIVADGIIIGAGNKINPLGMTNRAETAVILYRVNQK